jgi:hypothetical protein
MRVILSGSDLDMNNLGPTTPSPDPGGNGLQRIDINNPGVLPGIGEDPNLLPNGGLSITGYLDVDDLGNGTGEIILEGLTAATDTFNRHIKVSIGGAEDTFVLNIYKDQSKIRIPGDSLTISGDNKAYCSVILDYFCWPTGDLYLSFNNGPRNIFVTVEPEIPGLGLDNAKITIDDVNWERGVMAYFPLPSNPTADTYTFTFEFGSDNSPLNYGKATATLEIKGSNNNGLDFTDPTLSWPGTNPGKPWIIRAANNNNEGSSKLVAENIPDPNYNLRTIDWEGKGVHVADAISIWVYANYTYPPKLVGTYTFSAGTFSSP